MRLFPRIYTNDLFFFQTYLSQYTAIALSPSFEHTYVTLIEFIHEMYLQGEKFNYLLYFLHLFKTSS